MIEVRPSASANAYLEDAPTDLLGELTFRLYDPADDTDLIAATTDGITSPSSGTYKRTFPAPDTEGLYRVAWDHPDLDEPLTEDVTVAGGTPIDGLPSWAPTLPDVGKLLKARTVDENNNYLGTFRNPTAPGGNDGTNPTADEAEDAIVNAVRDLRRDVGSEAATSTDETFLESLSNLAEYRTAMLIELHYPEANQTSDSSYEKWKRLYDDGIESVRRSGRRSGSITLVSPYSGDDDELVDDAFEGLL